MAKITRELVVTAVQVGSDYAVALPLEDRGELHLREFQGDDPVQSYATIYVEGEVARRVKIGAKFTLTEQ